MKDPMGRLGSCSPARARRTAVETARTASFLDTCYYLLLLFHCLEQHADIAHAKRATPSHALSLAALLPYRVFLSRAGREDGPSGDRVHRVSRVFPSSAPELSLMSCV
jgi:hypothetical protein